MTLQGKTLFITGASRGIGLAIGLRAARDGANVVIAAKSDAPHPKLPGTIHTAAKEIEAAGGRALPLVVDVRDEEAVKGALARAAETFGGHRHRGQQRQRHQPDADPPDGNEALRPDAPGQCAGDLHGLQIRDSRTWRRPGTRIS